MRLYQCLILLMAIFILAHPTACIEIAYSSGPNSEKPVGYANITEYKGTDKVSFTTSVYATSGSSRGTSTSTRTLDSIKEEINRKINPANELVRDEGLRLVGIRSGAQRIDQICSIYDYMVGNWTFVSDPRGLDVFQYANYTLEKGKEVGKSGKGDCDDFSILLASLVESIGGTPRIILAYSPASGGHAYTEVYLGNKSDKDVDRMLSWLRTAYKVNDISIHTDLVSGDVWLNMDWWKDPGGANHPGGPFYQATSQVPIYIQESVPKASLTPIENLLPRPLFNYSPLQPEVDEVVRFDASGSVDPDGKIVDYEWDFGDGDSSHKSISQHIYSSAGKFQVKLTITDNEEDKSIKTQEIEVKEPLPEAIGTYSPGEPKVGDVVTFDASKSKDKRGRIVDYEWDFDDGYSGKRAYIKHQYLESGTYKLKLNVTNDRGIQNTSIITVVVDQKENATDWYNKGKALCNQGKYDEAIQAFDKSIELDPNFLKAWNGKGVALKNQGKYDEAIQAYEKAIELDPTFADPWYNKGVALNAQGKHDEAIQAYDKAIELGPKDADSWNAKGVALKDQGKHDEAIQAYEKAIELDPTFALAWNNKGIALKALGRTTEANAAFAKTKELGY